MASQAGAKPVLATGSSGWIAAGPYCDPSKRAAMALSRLAKASMRESLAKMLLAAAFCGEMFVLPMENSQASIPFSGVRA